MTKGIGIMTAVCLLSASAVAFGHHSFAAEFDASKPVTLVGNVTKVDWLNPHIWVYLDVKDKDGKVSNWQCEGGPPNTLTPSSRAIKSPSTGRWPRTHPRPAMRLR